MRKKNNPEQEAEQPTEDQETEEITEEQDQETETEEIGEEPQNQDGGAEGEEETEEQEETPDHEEDSTPQQQDPTTDNGDENAGLRSQLLQAQGELAAYRAGVTPGMVADAVTLAMAEASKSGEVTAAAVTKAMEAVLKRHPEWKADAGDKKKTGGFRLGGDRDSSGFSKKQNNTSQNTKRWNRFK